MKKALYLLCPIMFLIISCNRETAEYRNGMARVQDLFSGKYGFINRHKKLVIEKKYDWAGDFYSNFATVELNNKRGLINKRGDIVIPIIHKNVLYIGSNKYFAVSNEAKTGVYNTKNEEIIPTVALNINKVYDDKYFEARLGKDENSICLFNNKGEQLTEAIFSKVSKLNGDFAIMQKAINKSSTSNKQRYEYKIFDLKKKDNPINKMPYYSYASFINPSLLNIDLLFEVQIQESSINKKTAIINRIGQIIIPFEKYDYIWNYGDNLFSVSVKGMKRGYADRKGNLVIKPVFDDAEKFENGIAKVTLMEKTFYIDKNGNCVKNCPTKKWLDFHKISGFKINKSLYQILIKQGLHESKKQNYLGSIEKFTSAINENPLDYESYHNRGLSFLMLNRLEEAEQDLNKSIKFNPNYSNSYYLRGNVHQRKGNLYSAISDFEKAIKLNPYNADLYLKCAIVYGKYGNEQKSCVYLKRACELGSYDACSGYKRFCE